MNFRPRAREGKLISRVSPPHTVVSVSHTYVVDDQVTCTTTRARVESVGKLDFGLMAKDKSEKKKRHASDAVPAEAEQDVEMKVSGHYACLKE